VGRARGRGDDELRGGVRTVVAEGEVFAVEVDEEVRDDEDHEDGYPEKDQDEEKVGLVGWELLDFHTNLDAKSGAEVEGGVGGV
jgi:hypothetical protein